MTNYLDSSSLSKTSISTPDFIVLFFAYGCSFVHPGTWLMQGGGCNLGLPILFFSGFVVRRVDEGTSVAE